MSQLKVPVGPQDHIRGPADAPITLVEYGDYGCPHCGAAYPQVEQVREHFGDDLRFVYRHFPLTQMHPMAEPAAEMAELADTRKRFWQMHDTLFENQDLLQMGQLARLASAAGLDAREVIRAIEARSFAARVRQDFLGGVRSGVNGTPTFFINGERHNGSYMFEDLADAIASRMKRRAA